MSSLLNACEDDLDWVSLTLWPKGSFAIVDVKSEGASRINRVSEGSSIFRLTIFLVVLPQNERNFSKFIQRVGHATLSWPLRTYLLHPARLLTKRDRGAKPRKRHSGPMGSMDETIRRQRKPAARPPDCTKRLASDIAVSTDGRAGSVVMDLNFDEVPPAHKSKYGLVTS